MTARLHIGFCIAAVWLGVSCISPHQSTAVDIDPDRWEMGAAVLLPNSDTTTLRDVTLFLRYNARFAEDSLTVVVETTSPNGLRHKEAHLLTIPRINRPAALLREIAIPYRRNVCFSQRGDYRLTISPTRSIEGVEAAGINIKKSK